MKEFLSKISTTSVLGVIWSVGTLAIILLAMSGSFKATEIVLTLCLNGLFGICGYIMGYFFGSSVTESKNKGQGQINITNTTNES